MSDWISADWHLGHANVIRFDNRPFSNVEEMNREIMKEAMTLLKPGDNFFYLGDLSFDDRHTEGWLATLKSSGANLFFIKGNHDKKKTINLYEKYGTYLGEQHGYNIGGQHCVLNHFAMRTWDRSHHGSVHFYAHSHGRLEKTPWGKSIDVGIPAVYHRKGRYTLSTVEELVGILEKREVKLLNDHHGKKEEI